jgi:hypothetical protein
MGRHAAGNANRQKATLSLNQFFDFDQNAGLSAVVDPPPHIVAVE